MKKITCVFGLVAAAICLLLYLSEKFTELSRENLKLTVKNTALTAAQKATEEAFALREEQRYAAAQSAERKKNACTNLANRADTLTDDELLMQLKRLCQEDGICATHPPKDATP